MERNFKYVYAAARVRYLENELLPISFFHRLIDAETIKDIRKLLGETVYGLREAEDFDILWEDELRRVSSILREVLPGNRLKKFFLYSYDLFNLKVLFKNRVLAKRGGRKNWDVLVDMGTVPLDRLISIIENEQYVYLPFYRRDGVYILSELLESMEKAELDTRFIDITLDKLYFHFMLEEARELEEPFLKEYMKTLIDLTNIMTFFRVKLAEQPKSFLADVLIPDGMLDEDKLVESYQDSSDVLVKNTAYSPYGKLIEEMANVYEESKNLALLERLVDNYLIDYAKRCKFIMFGIQPIVGFMIAKEMEVKNLRIVITGKHAGVPGNILRERLRDAYV
ncbi:MAG: V-type ATPase subunit [Synergistetes bacterium]|nr:V-type ATPase subunit [Synergistota bacterium]